MKEQTVTVKVTEMDLFYFYMYHNYTRPSGMMMGVMGIVALVVTPIVIGKDLISGLLFGVLAFSFIIQPILAFFLKSRSQLKKNPVFMNEMVFTIMDDGIHIDQYKSTQTLKWEQLLKVMESKRMILLYVSKVQAFLIPKSSFSSIEQQESFMEELEKKRGSND